MLSGSATGKLDVTGGTPATLATPTLNFSLTLPALPITTPVPLQVPSTPISLGPFTASSSQITVQNDSQTSLTLLVSGQPLTLTCTSYANNSVPSGIDSTGATPSGQPLAPVIAIAGGGSSATTAPPTPTTKPGTTTTGAKTVTASSSKLAFTGVGPGVGLLGIIGGIMILLGLALLMLVDAPRRMMSQLAVAGPAQWQRLRHMGAADRLANLNPMRWRRGKNEGVPDAAATMTGTTTTTVAATDDAAGRGLSARIRGTGDRFSRVPDMSRDFAQHTARAAVRAAQWLLGR